MNGSLRILKIVADSIAYYLAIAISIFVHLIATGFHPEIGAGGYLGPVLAGHLLFILSIFCFLGYRTFAEFPIVSETTALLKGTATTIIILVAASLFLRTVLPHFPTGAAGLGFILSLLIIPPFFRLIIRKVFAKPHHWPHRERTLVYGAGAIGRAFVETLNSVPHPRFQIIGFLDDAPASNPGTDGVPILGARQDLEETVKKHSVERLMVAIRQLSEQQVKELNSEAGRLGVKISFLPSIESFAYNANKLNDRSDIAVITTVHPTRPFHYRLGKRITDIVLSSIGLIILLPVHIVIAILIKRDSPGPVLFRHQRVGLNGRIFLMYKYRTMRSDTPQYAHCPSDSSDPRITKMGKWIRKLSIDETPQLWNVFRGHMSIVGPRPEMPFIVESYNEIEKARLSVKPGLTGLWQTSKMRDSEISHNLEYDFYYLKNQGFALDWVIMVLTVFFAFRGITH
jgi:exopolysaccharide biosynthesis polyprenyl glycosylphosphotransferase